MYGFSIVIYISIDSLIIKKECKLVKTPSLEANHLIWVWIVKVTGPKNQADFIEVLHVVVNA